MAPLIPPTVTVISLGTFNAGGELGAAEGDGKVDWVGVGEGADDGAPDGEKIGVGLDEAPGEAEGTAGEAIGVAVSDGLTDETGVGDAVDAADVGEDVGSGDGLIVAAKAIDQINEPVKITASKVRL